MFGEDKMNFGCRFYFVSQIYFGRMTVSSLELPITPWAVLCSCCLHKTGVNEKMVLKAVITIFNHSFVLASLGHDTLGDLKIKETSLGTYY